MIADEPLKLIFAIVTSIRKGAYHVAFGIVVDRNRIMHILNGNVRMMVANTNGVSVTGRWETILSRCQGIVVLSETHCTINMQKSLPYSAKDYRVV